MVDTRPAGKHGPRIRKIFETKGEASRFEAHVKIEYQDKPWQPTKLDTRRLSELCKLWHTLHGHTLKDADRRLKKLLNLCTYLGNPLAIKFTSKQFASYRQERLDSGVSPNTVNHEQAYLRAVFNELKRLGEWNGDNPLANIRRLKHKETELSFLTLEQIATLIKELNRGRNKDACLVAKVCLSTGARWSEAEGLELRHVHAGKVVFENPKDAERRAVPISAELAKEITQGKQPGRLFKSCYSAFRDAMERAGIETPKGQLSHVLRHTFASHFMQGGGNIITLQRVLGHSSLTVTMRYAHLAPDHLEEVLKLNPLHSGLFVDNAPSSMESKKGQAVDFIGGPART